MEFELEVDLIKLREVWQLEGLDSAKPLNVTDYSREAGTEITQVIDTNNNRTIVTRT